MFNNKGKLDSDLEQLLQEFILIKEKYNKSLLLQNQTVNLTTILKTEIHDSRLQERSQRNIIDNQRNAILGLQNTIDKLVEDKKELLNYKHNAYEKDREINEMNLRYNSTIEGLKQTMENLETHHSEEILQIQKEAAEKVEAAHINLELANADSTIRQTNLKKEIEMANTINRQKVTMVVLEYEEKLRKAGEQLGSLQKELEALKSRNSAGGNIYQKRVHELESKLSLLEQAQILSHNNPTLKQTPLDTSNWELPQLETAPTSTTSTGERKTIPKRRKLYSMNQQDDY